MVVKISSDNVTLIKNYGATRLENKKGAIVKIIAYLLCKPKVQGDETLGFRILGVIRKLDSDTSYNTGDYISVSEDGLSSFECVYSEQENYSNCFYFKKDKIFEEGFCEEIFVTDKDLDNYYNKISIDYITELSACCRIYSLREFKIAVENLFTNQLERVLLGSELLSNRLETTIRDVPTEEEKDAPVEQEQDKKTFQSSSKILGLGVEQYSIGNPNHKHKCLEIDEEFRERCSEFYEIHNSKFCLPMNEDDLIQSLIYTSKDYWDRPLLDKVNRFLKDEAVILDIGSNIGNHSLYWANERNAKLIYAFEPYPYTYKILEENVKINNLEEKIKIFPFGISDEVTKGSVVGFCPTNIGGTGFEKDKNGDFEFKTLDSIKIPEKIDLIKIDVEGAELQVLNGGLETIKKNRPIIIIETFDKKEQIEDILYQYGYELVDDNIMMCDYVYVCKTSV